MSGVVGRDMLCQATPSSSSTVLVPTAGAGVATSVVGKQKLPLPFRTNHITGGPASLGLMTANIPAMLSLVGSKDAHLSHPDHHSCEGSDTVA